MTETPTEPSDKRESVDAPSASTSTSASTSASASAGRATKKNVSMACEGCKASKRKCDGNTPCSNCAATKQTCTYDPSQDGRRKQSRKRRLDELEMRSQALDRLLISLKHSPGSEARELIELIRRDAPLEEILEFLDAHPGRVADETRAILSPSPLLEEPEARRVMTVDELTDEPIYKVPASPWTTVTKDDLFVSHLVSAYLSWYHWYYHHFDERLFLDAITAGQVDSTYCSPLLVNAVLGMGCFFSEHPSVFATPGDASSRGVHFYNEAQRLWTLEAGRSTLVNVQGFTIMIMLAAFVGKDRVSTISLKQLEVMIPQLLRQHKRSSMRNLSMSEDYQRSLVIVQWAAHFYSTGFGTGFLLPPQTKMPEIDDPYVAQKWESHLSSWAPYPVSRDPIELPLHSLYHYACELYSIVPAAQSLTFEKFAGMTLYDKVDAAEKMDARFLDWYRSIPTSFQFGHPDFVLSAPAMDIALSLHHFRLVMWNWLIPSAQAASPKPLGPGETPPPETPTAGEVDDVIRKAKDMCLEIVTVTTEAIRASDAYYGPVFNTLMTPQTGILAASFLFSGNLNSRKEEEMLLELMGVLVKCSRQRNLVKGITHMLLKTAEDQVAAAGGKVIPGAVSPAILEELTVIVKDLAWESRDLLSFSSQYPNHIKVKDDPDAELSDLLEKWAGIEDLQTSEQQTTQPVGSGDAPVEESEDKGKGKEKKTDV